MPSRPVGARLHQTSLASVPASSRQTMSQPKLVTMLLARHGHVAAAVVRPVVAAGMAALALLALGHLRRLLVAGVVVPLPALVAVEVEAAQHGVERLEVDRSRWRRSAR